MRLFDVILGIVTAYLVVFVIFHKTGLVPGSSLFMNNKQRYMYNWWLENK